MVYLWPLFLFGSPHIEVDHERGILKMDGWIEVRASPQVAVFLRELRMRLNSLMERKLAEPTMDISASPYVDAVCKLILANGVIV
jgi:ATP-dependent RNA helicase DHX57